MKNYIILFLFFINIFSFAQKSNKINYKYVKIIEQNWDTVFYEGALKMNKIEKVNCLLNVCSFNIDDSIKPIIKKELKNQVKILKSFYKKENFPKKVVIKRKKYFCYEFSGLNLLLFEHSVNYEFTNIFTIILIDGDKKSLCSMGSKLGLDLKIKCFKKENDKYIVYGYVTGNPETPYGGNFILTFDGGKRFFRYSYYEIIN